MRWDRFFEDLEDQLAAEWEAERAALDSEAERLRVSRLALRERLVAFAQSAASPLSIELRDGSSLEASVTSVGADWMAVRPLRAHGAAESAVLVPLPAIRSIGAAQGELLRSARPTEPESRLAQRVTFGFALRDLARRRAAMAIGVVSGRALSGTIDRVGADHLDLALHDPDSPRRSAAVTAFRIVSFEAVAWVRVAAAVGVVAP
ncbi:MULTISPECIES: hypothetical protein [unclassified Microbacterium]|uniref:hypothetical protein n=1 Tax=Microbacterium TaxID=33882 RepID=UPI003B9FFD82